MRHPWTIVVLCLLAACLLFPGCKNQGAGSLTGFPAPECTMTMLDGTTLSLEDLRGRPVLLEFWAPWCAGCLKNIAPLKELHKRFGTGLAVIAASSETGPVTVRRFVHEYSIPYPIALSSQRLLDLFQVRAIPMTVLIDRQGIIRYHHAGQFTEGTLEKQIRGLP
ncbi:TlpA family protein disulfide reductase [Desulfobulbus rhabdoformis]|uniref:TlpA family protein disulfide reductase n=1 Tax=Desulfobulbus rhabdoformis TaxID=34032 RepID=UPI0019667133|nr:TlpA disulfide reductase family protein [Desulfobulbus rhabdoformis]MBM9612843.1 TlpA family protein disulfide reductase [Desulfobulbus rhabdoformis]